MKRMTRMTAQAVGVALLIWGAAAAAADQFEETIALKGKSGERKVVAPTPSYRAGAQIPQAQERKSGLPR